MKIGGAKQIHYDSGPNMTPLVDVVMVILIFLMLTGSFVGAEHYLESNIPFSKHGAGSATPPPGGIPQDEPLIINVEQNATRDGFVARVNTVAASDVDSLTAVLVKKRQQLAGVGKPPEKVQVVITPGQNVKYKYLIDVYQAANNAQFNKVAFAKSR
ncbi:MAG: ExbD/TolR family protein [Tepidisphaeraceae bacterium]